MERRLRWLVVVIAIHGGSALSVDAQERAAHSMPSPGPARDVRWLPSRHAPPPDSGRRTLVPLRSAVRSSTHRPRTCDRRRSGWRGVGFGAVAGVVGGFALHRLTGLSGGDKASNPRGYLIYAGVTTGVVMGAYGYVTCDFALRASQAMGRGLV